ncbi:MAG: hypothetical protein IPG02_14985 [Ignavibacteria bacterium]|nr:hypothetical protein [Ignavibacteria bacterium]
MKYLKHLMVVAILGVMFFFSSEAQAQRYPVLYFCENYGASGETGVSDRFTTGYITVMVKADDAIGLRDCSIQLDKYNCSTGAFDYYKKFKFVVEPSMKYIYFQKNEESDMNFDTPGIFRVFLLDQNNRTVTSSLVEIIPKY